MNKALSVADRDSMRSEIDEIVAWSREAVGLVIKLHETNPSFYADLRRIARQHDGSRRQRGALDFYHGGLRARDADGGPIFDHVDYATYQSVLQEDIKNWSYMKFPHIRTLGADKGWYRVGPLARVQICDVMPTPLAEAERTDVPERRRRQAAAWRADVSLGAHDRDAARGRNGARTARRSRYRAEPSSWPTKVRAAARRSA